MIGLDWKQLFCCFWYFYFAMPPSATAVTLSWTNTRPPAGEVLTTALQADDFENMASLQFSLHWDTSLLDFVSYELIDWTTGLAIGDTEAANGVLRLSWFDPTGTGQSLAAGSELLALLFTVKACGGEEALLRFSDTPLAIQAYQFQQGESIEVSPVFEDGRFEFTIPDWIPIEGDTTLQFGDTLLLDLTCMGCTYLWNDGSTNAQLAISSEGFYELRLTTPFSCTYLDGLRVFFEDRFDQLLPINVISPNGDGLNDRLEFCALDQFETNQLTIFNRWGKILFDRLNYDNSWSGQYKNQDLPAGNYYYRLDLENGSKIIKSSLKIIRP